MPDGWRGSLQLSSSSTTPSLVLFGLICAVAFTRCFPIKLQPTPQLLLALSPNMLSLTFVSISALYGSDSTIGRIHSSKRS